MLKPFFVATIAVAAMLSGCATTSGGEAKVSQSRFDNAAIVDIAPHATAQVDGVFSSPALALSAQWQQKNGEIATIFVTKYMDIVGITGASLNIDGSIVNLTLKDGLTQFETISGNINTSRHGFGVDLSTIRRVTAAKRVWIKVNTTKGWVEDAIIDGDKDSKAFHAMKRFISQVDAVQAEKK
jgi:hypothetical protein